MKKTIVLLLSTLVANECSVFSQNEMADNVASELNTVKEVKKDSQHPMNFIEDYNINVCAGKKAKVITETQLKTSINKISEQNISISKGTIVEYYKYFPKEALWAIRHGEDWGFVPATVVVPLQGTGFESVQPAWDEAPKMLSEIHIKFPEEAKNRSIDDKIIIKALISKTGLVSEVEIVKSIPELDEAATEAIRKVRFKPGKLAGKPIETWITIPIDIKIDKS